VLQPSDDETAAHVAVLSHALWRLRFAADPTAVGQSIRIGGQAFEIVGVAEASFPGVIGGLDGTRLWIPLASEPLPASPAPVVAARDRRRLQVFGRLAPDTTSAAASAELASIAARLDAAFPRTPPAGAVRPSDRLWSAKTAAAISEENDGTRRFGLMLIALVSLVLVVACTNLANLMLARGTARQKELAVRAALGASRWRLIREQCVESLLLALGGAVAAHVAFQALQAWMTVDFNLMGRWTLSIRPTLDPEALAVATVALLLALMVFGLEPAIHLARAIDITGAIATAKSRTRSRRQRMVIRWQVAVSAGFFIVATMFVRQTIALARHDTGIDIQRIAVAVLRIEAPLWDDVRLRRTLERVMEEARADPAIEAVSVSTGLPFGVPTSQISLSRPGDAATASANPRVPAIAATPSFFPTLGVRILRGRAFDDRDDAGAAPVVIVSEFTARRLFGTVDAVGQQLLVQRRRKQALTATVIGVARDTDVRAILREPGPLVYMPLLQEYEASLAVVARSSQEADRAVPALREALRRADPDLPVDVIGTGHAVLSGPFEILRAGGIATLYLGGLTLLLAMAGLFGVQSHLIAHRTQEIGVRMSMGATARQIKAMVLLDGYRPVLEGLTLGLWGGFAGRVIVRAYVQIDVNVIDPWMLIVTPIPVIAAAFCACYLPARRAARVDPTIALRCE
jgi:predicted permease